MTFKNIFSKDGTKILILTLLAVLVSVAAYLWFITTPSFALFETWVQGNVVLFYVFLVLTKTLGVVWPPLPGNLFTLASIPFLGWFTAYTADFVGSMLGSSLAYFLGKKYGYTFINKIFSADMEKKIKSINVKQNREIESVFVLRMLGGGTIMEAVCYGAGLLNIKYKNFLIGSVLSHILFGVPLFLLTNQLFSTKNIVMTGIWIIVPIFILWKIKGRYFE